MTAVLTPYISQSKVRNACLGGSARLIALGVGIGVMVSSPHEAIWVITGLIPLVVGVLAHSAPLRSSDLQWGDPAGLPNPENRVVDSSGYSGGISIEEL